MLLELLLYQDNCPLAKVKVNAENLQSDRGNEELCSPTLVPAKVIIQRSLDPLPSSWLR
jgi:hypothetical protein